MTDRHAGYVVVLTNDTREDDAQPIIAAIRMIRGVADVRPIAGDVVSTIAETRARTVLTQKIWDALK